MGIIDYLSRPHSNLKKTTSFTLSWLEQSEETTSQHQLTLLRLKTTKENFATLPATEEQQVVDEHITTPLNRSTLEINPNAGQLTPLNAIQILQQVLSAPGSVPSTLPPEHQELVKLFKSITDQHYSGNNSVTAGTNQSTMSPLTSILSRGVWWYGAYIQQFFEEGIHESVSPGLKGFEYYYALDEINSKMDIWEQIDLVSKLGAMRNITNPNQTEVEEYGKLLELIDYYVPLNHFHVIQFISFIPKTERKDFLRELKLLDPNNIVNAANFRSQQLIRLYNDFKLKFSEEEEVNLVHKKKGYKRFCKTCKTRHFGKCPNKQEESVNFADLGYNSKSICSEHGNYLVLVEQENEEVNLVEQNE